MNDIHPSTREVSTASSLPEGGLRKPYLKPAFRHEQVFETMALACGKIQSTQQGCTNNRRAS